MKNIFELRENEVMENDVDELMDNEISMFLEKVKVIPENNRTQFRNWVKIYKMLNYDIFEDLKVQKVYRFNKCAAVIQLNYKGQIEYDFLAFDENDMTVTVMGIKGDKVKKEYVRRLLIPKNSEEALMYAKAPMDEEIIMNIGKSFKDLQDNKAKFDITDKLAKYLELNVEVKEEKKVESKKAVKEEKKVESRKVAKVEKPVVEKKVEKVQEGKKEVKVEKPVVYGTIDAVKAVREGRLNEAIMMLDKHVYSHVDNLNLRKEMIKTFIRGFQDRF